MNIENNQTNRTGRRWLVPTVASAAVIAGIAAAILYWAFIARFSVQTDDAYVEGNIVQVTPLTVGTVSKISVDDTQYVKEGDPLVWLDSADAEVALEHARANLAATVRHVAVRYAQRRELQALVQREHIALDKAKADYQRRTDLVADGSISREALSHSRDALRSAASALEAGRQKLVAAEAQVAGTTLRDHPEVLGAMAAYETAWLNLKRTIIVAPASGVVAERSAQVGERVQPGTPLLALVPDTRLWVDANFKETELRHMRIGQPVTISVDAWGSDVAFHGRLVGLAAGTGGAFSLLPPQNATGNWIKVVQRVPVRISLDPDELRAHPLRVGLSVIARVAVRDRSGAVLNQTYTRTPRDQTRAYDGLVQAAEQQAQVVVAANLPHGSVQP